MSKADYFKELNYRLRGLPEKERHNILKVYEELFQKAVENGKHENDVAQSLGYPRVPNWDAQKDVPTTPPPIQDNTHKAAAQPKQPEDFSFNRDDHENEEELYETYAPIEPTIEQNTYGQATKTWEPPAYTQPQPNYPPGYNASYPNPYPTRPETTIKAIIISIMLGFFNLIVVLGPWVGICAALIAFFVAGFGLLIAPVVGVLTSLAGNTGSDFQFISFSLLACFGLGIILTTLSTWLLKQFFKLSWKYIQFNAKLIKGA